MMRMWAFIIALFWSSIVVVLSLHSQKRTFCSRLSCEAAAVVASANSKRAAALNDAVASASKRAAAEYVAPPHVVAFISGCDAEALYSPELGHLMTTDDPLRRSESRIASFGSTSPWPLSSFEADGVPLAPDASDLH